MHTIITLFLASIRTPFSFFSLPPFRLYIGWAPNFSEENQSLESTA